MTVILVDTNDGREALVDCDHGTASVFDRGPQWTDEQLTDFVRLVLAQRARCDCFGARTWMPPKPPDHVRVTECRLYETSSVDPEIERTRPDWIPGPLISLAAARVFDTRIPSADHSLDQDWRMVRLAYQEQERRRLREPEEPRD